MLAVDFRLPNPKFLNRWFIELMWAGVGEEGRGKGNERTFQSEGVWDWGLPARLNVYGKSRRLTKKKGEGQEERGVVVCP